MLNKVVLRAVSTRLAGYGVAGKLRIAMAHVHCEAYLFRNVVECSSKRDFVSQPSRRFLSH